MERSALHLVHIGFDKNSQTSFEQSIKERIIKSSDMCGSIINFVDEIPYTPEEIELLQVELLAKTLKYFLSYQRLYHELGHLDLAPFYSNNPTIVIHYLEEKLQQDIYIIRSEVEDITYPEESQHYLRLRGEGFLEILQDLVQHFTISNPYQLPTIGGSLYVEPKNSERRKKIYEFAVGHYGKERVLQHGMNNEHPVRYSQLQQGKNLGKGVWDDKFPTHKKEYGNAGEYIHEALSQETKIEFDRVSGRLPDILLEKGFSHKVGGEYAGKCVRNYAGFLKLCGIEENYIQEDDAISLST